MKQDAREIERLRVDDLLQRTFLSLVSDYRKNQVDLTSNKRMVSNDRVIGIVCDSVRDSFDKVITLIQMQELTGLSNRALCDAFRKRFDCTQREWQHKELLNKARVLLQSNGSNLSVTEVSHHHGFLSEVTFTWFYLNRFGELPSETIIKKK